MADIDVKRTGPSLWPWILGLLVLALLIWGLSGLLDRDPEVAEIDEVADVAVEPVGVAAGAAAGATVAADAGMPPAVSTYLTECTAAGEPAGDMGLEHQFTVTCLQHLRAGLAALLEGAPAADAAVTERLEAYAQSVQRLEGSAPTATNHADLTRDAAGTAVAAMEAMRGAWPGDDPAMQAAMGEVRQAAEGIRSGVPLLEQRDSVRGFFREAGDVLRLASGARTA